MHSQVGLSTPGYLVKMVAANLLYVNSSKMGRKKTKLRLASDLKTFTNLSPSHVVVVVILKVSVLRVRLIMRCGL